MNDAIYLLRRLQSELPLSEGYHVDLTWNPILGMACVSFVLGPDRVQSHWRLEPDELALPITDLATLIIDAIRGEVGDVT